MIHIKVPATSANLGPGFDTLGLALNLYHEIAVAPSETGESVVRWQHQEQSLLDGENLVVEGMYTVFKKYGADPVPFQLDMRSCDIPVSRGLGSSAAAYVSGVVAGLYLLNLPIDRETVLKIASDLEGHPDNVAPAIYGGVVASCMTGREILFQPIPLGRPLQFIALVPDCKLSTQAARSVLPDVYPKADVMFTLARLSILISSLQNGEFEHLRVGTEDMLHQPHRLGLMPDAELLRQLSQSHLVYGGFVSGAGSTYMLMCSPERLAEAMALASDVLGGGGAEWRVKALDLELDGTKWEVS